MADNHLCACPMCSTDQFKSLECMFCHAAIPPIGGKLRSANGARMCQTCLKACADGLGITPGQPGKIIPKGEDAS